MSTKNYNVMGVMSGTSLDGVDLACITLSETHGQWAFAIGACQTVPYTDAWISRLKAAVDFSHDALQNLNTEYTLLLGTVIRDFIQKNHVTTIDAVCSHGHTILHQPQHQLTLQIGNLPEIAQITQQQVVCDFRVQDVLMGGQGAPLVPMGDRLLFPDFDYCLNLGGFSNISFEADGRRVAFDISPVNTVLNRYAEKLGQPYDDRGRLAASGSLQPALLEALNGWDFYGKPFPKSLGFESVQNIILPLIESFELKPEDVLHTFCVHVAQQLALALPKKSGKMLVTGGGAYNDFLMKQFQKALPQVAFTVPDALTLEYKEALIFALLGVLKLRGENNVLASVTGAPQDHSAGVVFPKP